jgi:CubicO group peptidase (beta-lactamase class C family)
MRRRSLLTGALAALVPLPSIAQTARAADQIRDFVALACEHWRIPGAAVAVVHQGQPLLAMGYGVKSLATREAVDERTAFNIGSCSKAYTACAAALLVEEGRIGWDDPVKAVYPELALYDPDVTAAVTLRDLLSHRVGLSRAHIGEYGSTLPRSDVLARAAQAPKAAEFRSAMCYSNLGFVIAGEVIARVAGMPFEDFVAARILQPLGMAGSSVQGRGWEQLANVAGPHEDWDHRIIPVPPLDHGNTMGAGSLYVSAQDALAWLQLQVGGGTLVSQRSLDEMHEAQIEQPQRYGLGWNVGTYDGHAFAVHDGGTRGFTARTRIDPSIGYGVFVAVNTEHAAVGAITSFVSQALIGLRPQDWIDVTDTAEARNVTRLANELAAERRADPIGPGSPPLAAFAGDYRHPGLGTLSLRAGRGALRAMIKDMWIYDGWLVRYGSTRFAHQSIGFRATREPRPIRAYDSRFRFVAEGTNVTAVEINDSYMHGPRFERA